MYQNYFDFPALINFPCSCRQLSNLPLALEHFEKAIALFSEINSIPDILRSTRGYMIFIR